MISLKKIDAYKHKFNESNFKKKTMPKILSLMFAIIFWLYVMDQVNPEMVRTISNLPVEILNQEVIQSGGYVVLEENIPTVSVKIKGRRKAVMNIKPEDIILSADVKEFHRGVNYFPIGKKIFSDNVTVESLSENKIQMTIDRLTEVTKDITIKTTGKLGEGESLGEITPSLKQVVVKGPETMVKSVVGVVGELDLATAENNAVANINLKAVDKNGQTVQGVSLSSLSVSVTLGVLKENSAKVEAVLTGSTPMGYKITQVDILPQTVALKGKAENFVTAAVIKTQSIDISGITSSQDLNVALDIPTGSEYVDLPKTVKVHLTVEKIEEREFVLSASQIKWLNVPAGIGVNLADSERKITVKIKGVSSVMEKLTEKDIQLDGDAGDLKEGTLKIKIEGTCGFETESIIVVPGSIEVEGVRN